MGSGETGVATGKCEEGRTWTVGGQARGAGESSKRGRHGLIMKEGGSRGHLGDAQTGVGEGRLLKPLKPREL